MKSVAAFSLIEILVVVAIIAFILSLGAFNFATRDARNAEVRAAAQQLAATMRQARALAMERKATFAVVFHIQNDPASTGRVLNNRSGGHYYRILGPNSDNGSLPTLSGEPYGPYTIVGAARSTAKAWQDEIHALPAKKVRFLALTDLDYGDYRPAGFSGNTGRSASTTTSYPRPWFGWYDRTSQRLYPWGGYDPAIPGSGFHYWGLAARAPTPSVFSAWRDPQPTTCTNPVQRLVDAWVSNNLHGGSTPPEQPLGDVVYEAGTPRPLLNADWRDVSLVFTANGEVRWGGFLPMRRNDMFSDTYGNGKYRRGIAERCNGQSDASDRGMRTEVGTFSRSSGGWWITLAPDSLDDQDTFPSAEEALRSLMPMYRVFVSSFGEIRVVAVSRTPVTDGLTPFPATESWWRTGTNTLAMFGQDRLVDDTIKASDGKTGVGPTIGRPITDFITPAMLAERQVWLR